MEFRITDTSKPIHVLNDNVLVEVESSTGEGKTKSGLYVPTTGDQYAQISVGIVRTVGDGTLIASGERIAPKVFVGDTVWFPRVNATAVTIEERTFYVIPAGSLTAVQSK